MKINWNVVSICLSVIFVFSFWWARALPYYRLEKALTSAPVREIRAEDVGQILETTLSEGDIFETGSSLFSLTGSLQQDKVERLEKNILRAKEQIVLTKIKSDEIMEQYTFLQKELGLTTPTEVTDEILAEAQEWQEKGISLESKIAQWESDKGQIEQVLSKQVAIAPFSGMVIKRLIQAGEKAEVGSPVLLVCSRDLSIEAEIPERMLSKIVVGLPATIRLPSFPDKTWEGKVAWISPTAKDGKIKVRVSAQDLPFKMGLTANVSVKIR